MVSLYVMEKFYKFSKFKILKKYINFIIYLIIDTTFIFYCCVANLIKHKKLYEKNLILVSAVDDKYYKYLKKLILNIQKYKFFTKIIIYNLGMTSDQIFELNSNPKLEVRDFRFDDYPSFIKGRNLAHDNKLGAYAWKSVVIREVALEHNQQTIWLDSANKINRLFVFSKIALLNLGFFSPYSTGTIQQWTYHSVLSDLNINPKIEKKPNLNGAIIGFDVRNQKGLKLLNEWNENCLVQQYISPEGSSRENHRHDQSLLSIFSYKYKFFYYPKSKSLYGVSIHNWDDRIYFIQTSENDLLDKLRKSWYKEYGNISTTTFKKAKIIIFLDINSYLKFNKMRLLNKNSYVFVNYKLNQQMLNNNRFTGLHKKSKYFLKKSVNFIETKDLSNQIIKDSTYKKFKKLNN